MDVDKGFIDTSTDIKGTKGIIVPLKVPLRVASRVAF